MLLAFSTGCGFWSGLGGWGAGVGVGEGGIGFDAGGTASFTMVITSFHLSTKKLHWVTIKIAIKIATTYLVNPETVVLEVLRLVIADFLLRLVVVVFAIEII